MIKIACRKHPKYRALEEPRANCEECLELYAIKLQALKSRLQVN